MKVIDSAIGDVKLIAPTVYSDERGSFFESWSMQAFASDVAKVSFVQDNHSTSAKHTLRGLHYQIQQSQGKLVRVVKGEVFDVAVDIRRSSPHFGKYVSAVLSADNKLQLWVPPGFAHGFLALSDDAEFLYKCTDNYAPQFERTIIWNDPTLDIAWPLDSDQYPMLSPKDQQGVTLNSAECFE